MMKLANHFLTNCLCTYMGSVYWIKNKLEMEKENSVFTFKIESTFDEWAAIFDSAEADKRHSEFDIKPLFRGVSKEDPQKIIVIHQAPEGNVQKFVEANGDWMATHRVDLSTMEESSWTASLTKESCCD